MKKILIVLDGASGLPENCFAGKTPLEMAETPNLDYFTKKGRLGFMYPIDEKTIPGSDNSLISILGNNPKNCGRGVFEAVGAGIKLKRGDLAVRINLGTIDNLTNRKIIDRRAGRTLTSKEMFILAKSLNSQIKVACKFEFYPLIQHRGVLIFRGGFSDNITDTDSEWASGKEKKFRFSEPFDDEDEIAKYTANILNDFITQAFHILENHPVNIERKRRGLLPANIILTRGANIEIPKLNKYPTWMSINSMPLEIGIAKLSGMANFAFVYPPLKKTDVYANLYKSLNKTIKFAIKIIKRQHKNYSGCYIQFKETDIPGHDNKPHEKKNMLELIDKRFFGFLRKFARGRGIKIVVTCDHSTPCKLKSHSTDPVPVLVYDGKGEDDTIKFSEKEAKKGSLHKFYGKDFMKKTGLNK